MVGWRETREVWPALAVSGLSFAAMQFYWSNYQESGLVDIIAALFSLLAMVAFLKVWRPRTILENPAGPDGADATSPRIDADPAPLDLGGAQGMVAVPAGLGAHLRLGAAAGRRAT